MIPKPVRDPLPDSNLVSYVIAMAMYIASLADNQLCPATLGCTGMEGLTLWEDIDLVSSIEHGKLNSGKAQFHQLVPK